MRRLIVVAVALAVMFLGPSAQAQLVSRDLVISVCGGAGFPLGDYPVATFGSRVQTGVGGNLAVDRMLTGRISVGAAIGIIQNNMDVEDLLHGKYSQERPDFKWRTMQASARGRCYFFTDRPLAVFGQFGTGIYLNKFSSNYEYDAGQGTVQQIKRSDTHTDFGMNLGAGALLRVSRSAFVTLEATANHVFTTKGHVRYIGLLGGLVFRIPMTGQ